MASGPSLPMILTPKTRSGPGPDAWATADDRSAAAEVRFEGERYYVLARTTPGDVAPQYVAVPAAPGGTLDDFVELVRSARR